jgi:hypothetical protein
MRLTNERKTLIENSISDWESHPIIGKEPVRFLKELLDEIDSLEKALKLIDLNCNSYMGSIDNEDVFM